MIHVCYGLYDGNGRYSKFTGPSILSMFENVNTPPRSVTVHLLHDNTLTDDNRDKFSYIAGQYNQLIKFYNVEKICANEIQQFQILFAKHKHFKRFSVGCMFRLLMTKILPENVNKIIYLDSDTIVNLDISELWKIPLEDKVLAARPEDETGNFTINFPLCKDGFVNPTNYFNSGVIVINLEKLRGNYETLQAGIKFIAENPQYGDYMDQEILNYCFSKDMVKLPKKFNLFVRSERGNTDSKIIYSICHYLGLGASLNLNMNDKFNRLWFSYFEKTTWFNADIIAHFYEEFVKFNVSQKNLAIQISALMSGKSRAFFTAAPNVDFIIKVFSVQEGEEIIPAVNQESLNVLKESMKASAGKKVYFILISNDYYSLRADLMKNGFVEGRDFVNAVQFLSDAHGVPLDTHNLLKAL